jgi:hypothetical protein
MFGLNWATQYRVNASSLVFDAIEHLLLIRKSKGTVCNAANKSRNSNQTLIFTFCFFINSSIVDKKTMSENYQVIDSTVPRFITVTVVDWVDLLIRPIYFTMIDESLNYRIKEKRAECVLLRLYDQSYRFNCTGHRR